MITDCGENQIIIVLRQKKNSAKHTTCNIISWLTRMAKMYKKSLIVFEMFAKVIFDFDSAFCFLMAWCFCNGARTFACTMMTKFLCLYTHQTSISRFNSLRPRQNRCHSADVFKCNFLNENVSIPIKISLKFVPKGPINNIPALVEIMAWHWTDDKPLSEPMMA